jgi:hypothetical protein
LYNKGLTKFFKDGGANLHEGDGFDGGMAEGCRRVLRQLPLVSIGPGDSGRDALRNASGLVFLP